MKQVYELDVYKLAEGYGRLRLEAAVKVSMDRPEKQAIWQ